jgi:hypothetical protein
MSHAGGHCATDADTIYVENKNTGCANAVAPNAGTAAMPYCHPQPAVDAATAGTKRLIVLRGAVGFSGFSASIPSGVLSMVSQSTSYINGGGSNGITLNSGELYLRGVRIKYSTSIGVQVEAAGTLRMNRCIVEENAGGGILVNGGGYDITNTVVANNGTGVVGPISWGGVFISVPSAGKPARFLNNTIYKNMAQGLVCTGPITHSGLIAYGNGLIDITSTCNSSTATACCTGDPMLNASYHLTAGSPCIDKLPAAMSTPDDLDGDPRPLGAMSDCGADEYKQ